MSDIERAYAAADSWRALAEAAENALADAARAAEALYANNKGPAIDAFAHLWRAAADPALDGPLPRLVQACRRLAEQCEAYDAGLAPDLLC